MKLEEYLVHIQFDPKQITYEEYCAILDSVYGRCSLTELSLIQIQRSLTILFKQLRSELRKISSQFKLSTQEIIAAFKSRDAFGVLKGFGFNVKLMFNAIKELTKFVREGLLTVFKELEKTKAIQKLRRGFIKVDDLIKRHPILTKVTGIALAGLLLYIWLNMTFIGDFEYDFDFTQISDALAGKFSIADMFLSPEGLMLISLFGTGFAFGLSVPWLGKSLYNLVLAIIYTSSKKMKESGYKFDKRLALMYKRIGKERL